MLYLFDKNMLINGNNLDGMKLIEGLLSYDLIVIDPIHQTKHKSFNYNNNKFSKEQGTTNLQERLGQAHGLLKEDGALLVHSNGEEYASIRMIMDSIFGEQNYVNTFIQKCDMDNKLDEGEMLNRAFDFYLVYSKTDQFYYRNTSKNSSENRRDGFQTTKNVEEIKQIIDIFTDKNSKILDFHTGNGTTAHAIMELNHEDGGQRQFIMVTNDSCSTICKPRLDELTKKYDETYKYIVIN